MRITAVPIVLALISTSVFAKTEKATKPGNIRGTVKRGSSGAKPSLTKTKATGVMSAKSETRATLSTDNYREDFSKPTMKNDAHYAGMPNMDGWNDYGHEEQTMKDGEDYGMPHMKDGEDYGMPHLTDGEDYGMPHMKEDYDMAPGSEEYWLASSRDEKYNCMTKEQWSVEKQDWCCIHEAIGCYTTQTDHSSGVPDEHDYHDSGNKLFDEHEYHDSGSEYTLADDRTKPSSSSSSSSSNTASSVEGNNNKAQVTAFAPKKEKVIDELTAAITLSGTTERDLLESAAMQRSIVEGYAAATRIDRSQIQISKIGTKDVLVAKAPPLARSRILQENSESTGQGQGQDARFAGDALDAARDFGAALQNSYDTAANSTAWSNVKDGAADAAAATGSAVKTGLSTIKSGAVAAANSSIWGDLKEGAGDAAGAAGSGIKTGAIAAGDAIHGGASAVAGGVKSLWNKYTSEPLKVHFLITLGSGAKAADVERVQSQVLATSPSDVQIAILIRAGVLAPEFNVAEFEITALSKPVEPGTEVEDSVLGKIAAASGMDKQVVAGSIAAGVVLALLLAIYCSCCRKTRFSKKAEQAQQARSGNTPVSVQNLEKRLDVAAYNNPGLKL